MAKKRGKSVSFDAMVKFFMNAYQIPTKRDIDGLNARLDRIERLVMNAVAAGKTSSNAKNKTSDPLSASDVVLEVIKRYKEGVDFAEIQLQTGYADKKLRNILFRLNKLQKIRRVKRGVYVSQ